MLDNDLFITNKTIYYADYTHRKERRESINQNRSEIGFAVDAYEGLNTREKRDIDRFCDLLVFCDYFAHKSKAVIYGNVNEGNTEASVMIKGMSMMANTKELFAISVNLAKYADTITVHSANGQVFINIYCEI